MGKPCFRMKLDIIFEALPIALYVTNLFATAADRQEAFKFGDMQVQAEDASGDLNAGHQLVRVEGFGQKIIRTGVHRFEIVGLSFERSEQD